MWCSCEAQPILRPRMAAREGVNQQQQQRPRREEQPPSGAASAAGSRFSTIGLQQLGPRVRNSLRLRVPEVAPETSEEGWRNATAIKDQLHVRTQMSLVMQMPRVVAFDERCGP